MAAIITFETHVVTKLLHNSESWDNRRHFERLGGIQKKTLAASLTGTRRGMVELDGQMLTMH